MKKKTNLEKIRELTEKLTKPPKNVSFRFDKDDNVIGLMFHD